MPELNRVELEEILAYIKDHPEEHDQRHFKERGECGITYCFAGHAIVRAGYEMVGGSIYLGIRQSRGTLSSVSYSVRYVPPGVLAQEILGLTPSQSNALFYVAQTLDDVEQTVKGILNGEIL